MNSSPRRLYESPAVVSPLRRQFWQQLNLPVEWVEQQAEASDGLVVSPEKPEIPVGELKRVTREILLLHYYDFLSPEQGVLWPRSIAGASLPPLILRHAPALDLRGWALVTGVSAVSRMALEVVFQLGFRKVRLVHGREDEGAAEALRGDLQKFLFGLEIALEKYEDLTLQPNNGSILVNTVDLSQDDLLAETLMYLNFVHRPGVIVDLPFSAQESPLVTEARLSGFTAIGGKEVRAAWDYTLLREMNLLERLRLSEDEYAESWGKFLETQPREG